MNRLLAEFEGYTVEFNPVDFKGRGNYVVAMKPDREVIMVKSIDFINNNLTEVIDNVWNAMLDANVYHKIPKYDSDWNALMRILSKISELGYSWNIDGPYTDDSEEDLYLTCEFVIKGQNDYSVNLIQMQGKDLFGIVYDGCYEFIKTYYNGNTEKV